MDFPDWMALITLYLETHFAGKTAVVFTHPLGNGDGPEAISKILAAHGITLRRDQSLMMINCEYAIIPCPTVKVAIDVCNDTPKNIYTFVWNGNRDCHENT